MLAPLPARPGPLDLRRPPGRAPLELMAGDAQVGWLERAWGKGGARAEAADGAWEFARARGLLSSRVDVRAADGAALGTFERTLGRRGGRITLHDHELELVTTRGDWHWAHAGTPLVRILDGDRQIAARFELTPEGAAYALRALLLLLGAHVVLRMEEEARN